MMQLALVLLAALPIALDHASHGGTLSPPALRSPNLLEQRSAGGSKLRSTQLSTTRGVTDTQKGAFCPAAKLVRQKLWRFRCTRHHPDQRRCIRPTDPLRAAARRSCPSCQLSSSETCNRVLRACAGAMLAGDVHQDKSRAQTCVLRRRTLARASFRLLRCSQNPHVYLPLWSLRAVVLFLFNSVRVARKHFAQALLPPFCFDLLLLSRAGMRSAAGWHVRIFLCLLLLSCSTSSACFPSRRLYAHFA